MYNPIEGGSTKRLKFDDEYIDVHLPPVGYVEDLVPNPYTGKPSRELIKAEILFEEKPLEQQKWVRTDYPEGWQKWIADEKIGKRTNKFYFNAEAERFRMQEWRRRYNGVWIALGHRS